MTDSNKDNNKNGDGADAPQPDAPQSDTSQPVVPQITFSMFIMSLSTSAMMHMGMIKNPVSGKEERDLPLAKQSIDILEMLKEKTEGNRDDNEEHLMGSVLKELKMKFVSSES